VDIPKGDIGLSVKQAMVQAAKNAFASAQQANTKELGVAPTYSQIVDGRIIINAPLESVPGGR